MIELRKNILIIPATPGGLSSTEDYLTEQGWTVTSRNDLKEALQHLINDQPAVVLVCMDHSNKNVRLLPDLILERIRCCVIATTQRSTVENYRLLQKVKSPYKLFPPSAGAAVQRVFLKYENRLNGLIDIRSSFETKRSGISPKMFRLNIKNERKESPASFKDRVSSPHLLVQGTERLINEIIETENTMPLAMPQPLKRTSQITCMLIECDQFQGYLVAALGGDCHLDEGFNAIIRKHLIQFLKEQGESTFAIETFNMNIKPVAFLEWAADYADFLRKSIHKQNEIAFAFFPLEGVRASYQSSATEDMLSVPIDELFGEAQVGFDLYIFFPANKRYVLYTPAGSVFYNHQKDRLAERGIEKLHIRRSDLSELNRYRAQKYFNTIVEEYNSDIDMPA